ncbi:MAG TPA: ABC transporter ATP-binding protein [Thermoanaerobaculia bacterium]|nr:ABC transporter ATP-binding protein [Thermoanaerobaculia bacterium]
MRILLRYAMQHWRALIVAFTLATINQLLLLADPQILRLVVDRYVLKLDSVPREQFMRGVLTLVALSVLIALAARIARNLQDYTITRIARRIGARLYAASIAHSLLLPFQVHEDRRSGELLHTMQRARDDAEAGVTSAVRLYLGGLAMLLVTGYAFYVHVLLGALQMGLIASLAIFTLWISRPIHRHQQRISAETVAQAGSATETIRNVELVKSLGIEIQEIGRLEKLNEHILSLEERKLRLVRLFNFVEGTAMSVARALVMLTMLWLVLRREITVGEFLSMFLYSTTAFVPLVELGNAVVRYQQARASFGQLNEVLNLPTDRNPASATRVGALKSIRFHGVSLIYPNGTAALRAIDFELRPGETTAFVGPSGSGKSTIVKLLVGLYQPSEGTITINGINSQEVDRDDLRRRAGLVTHDTHLFSGTIGDNLRLAGPDASDEECLAAIQKAAATPILERGGKGLQTRVGEGGLKLSGGERQRIAIARALLRHPEVLIFDEATSNLDTLTERAVSDTIRDVAVHQRSRITLLIAHRLSTVAHADRIIVLESGNIVESGTHSELLARRGLYERMWREQSEAA